MKICKNNITTTHRRPCFIMLKIMYIYIDIYRISRFHIHIYSSPKLISWLLCYMQYIYTIGLTIPLFTYIYMYIMNIPTINPPNLCRAHCPPCMSAIKKALPGLGPCFQTKNVVFVSCCCFVLCVCCCCCCCFSI